MSPLQLWVSSSHPSPLSISKPHLGATKGLTSGTEGDNCRAAPPVTWVYLSPDAWRPRQEVIRWPNDLPWWPFLSSCCSSERKDVVCCPQVPLSPSSLLSRTRKKKRIIDSRLVSCIHFSLCLLHFSPSLVLASTTSHFSFLSSSLIFYVSLWEVSKHLDSQETTESPHSHWDSRDQKSPLIYYLCLNCTDSHMFMHVIVILLAIFLL